MVHNQFLDHPGENKNIQQEILATIDRLLSFDTTWTA
jgi:hypothetical protein